MLKGKKVKKMKALEEDPCSTCLYGKAREQHNIPKAVENFNRVKPVEAFGPSVKKNVAKPKVKPTPTKKSKSKKSYS